MLARAECNHENADEADLLAHIVRCPAHIVLAISFWRRREAPQVRDGRNRKFSTRKVDARFAASRTTPSQKHTGTGTSISQPIAHSPIRSRNGRDLGTYLRSSLWCSRQ
jgi:hypothetical protein